MSSKLAVAIMAVLAIAIGLFELHEVRDGLRIVSTDVGRTPITIFQAQATGPVPVVLIAHGFAGSQQLMQPLAETLARNGYIAVTFDFLGHGRNPVPMRGDISEGNAITLELLKELGEVSAYARTLPASDGRMAVLGHSMASDIVIRFAQANPEIAATVAVSAFSPVVTATSPPNLLVIVGALEPSMLRNEGLRIVNLAADGKATPGVTYGNFADGTARALVLARGVEHIGVLYSRDSLLAALRWINDAFGRQQQGFIDDRGPWLALLFLGIIALTWPLSHFLPIVSPSFAGANLPWKRLLIAAILPALLTPLMLWKLPTDFLPILLGDYLALHFFLYGALTAALLLFWHDRLTVPRFSATSLISLAVSAVLVAAYNIVAFGWPIDIYLFSFLPIPARIPLMAAIACGTLPFFLVDEWLTRGAQARPGAFALTKFCFLLSLAIAVALNPMKLFFLIIILPAILLLFAAFALISRWSYRATRHPLPGAIASAAVFAWAIAVAFPMIVK